jgi:hypothetical protein
MAIINQRVPSTLSTMDEHEQSMSSFLPLNSSTTKAPLSPKRTTITTQSRLPLRHRSTFGVNNSLIGATLTWFFLGIASICTTKILLMKSGDFAVPPLVLTLQQFVLGGTFLRIYLGMIGKVRPLPPFSSISGQQQDSILIDLVLAGLFNGLDFLASNTSFSHSSATFVETIKSSEPITTTAIALLFGIDQLRLPEAISLGVLISGVLFATVGNALSSGDAPIAAAAASAASTSLHHSIKTALVAMTANVCFAMRAKCQKVVRASPQGRKLDDINLMMQMQQVGALLLLLPFIVFELPEMMVRCMEKGISSYYIALSIGNAFAFCMYTLASCFVLTQLSVFQHTGLGCVRRMMAIVFTSIQFGVPMTPFDIVGVVLCFSGFCSFSHYRNKLAPLKATTSGKVETAMLLPHNGHGNDPAAAAIRKSNRKLKQEDFDS